MEAKAALQAMNMSSDSEGEEEEEENNIFDDDTDSNISYCTEYLSEGEESNTS